LNSEYSSVTVKLTSMSRRSYALSFDGVQCCVDGTGRSPYHWEIPHSRCRVIKCGRPTQRVAVLPCNSRVAFYSCW